MRKKQKLYFHLGVLCTFAVFFFNSLLRVFLNPTPQQYLYMIPAFYRDRIAKRIEPL
jgi:hypothetical protein